jgi:hypothetical protein
MLANKPSYFTKSDKSMFDKIKNLNNYNLHEFLDATIKLDNFVNNSEFEYKNLNEYEIELLFDVIHNIRFYSDSTYNDLINEKNEINDKLVYRYGIEECYNIFNDEYDSEEENTKWNEENDESIISLESRLDEIIVEIEEIETIYLRLDNIEDSLK